MAAPRWIRETGWLAAGVAAVLILAAVGVYVFTQTDPGRARVLQLTLDRLGAGIEGELVVERIDGNLLTGAKLYGFAIRSRSGEPFILADSGYVDYDPRTLVTPRVVLRSLVLYDPEIYVRRLPGDTLWNYQKIFPGDPEAQGPERITLIDRLRVLSGYVRVQLPWVPDTTLSARAQREEIREALADTSELMVRRVPGGYLRTIEVFDVDGAASRVRFAPGTEAGTFVAVDRLNGIVKFFRTPFRVTHAEGEVVVLEDRVEYRAPRLGVNGSPLSSFGVIRPGGQTEEPRYDVLFASDSVDLGDFRWLYPRFPEKSAAAGELLIETRPEGTLFLGQDVVLRAPGTRVVGDFGMVVGGDTLRFVDVELRADPLRVGVIEEMLPEGIPVEGLRIGSATIRGVPARRRS